MTSNEARCRLVILGPSSVLRLTHRKAKIPVFLVDIMVEGVKAYWENGSLAGFQKIMDKKIGELIEKSAIGVEPLLTSEPEDSSAYNAFIMALYQEIFAFCEFAQLQTTLYLGHVSRSHESVNVIFSEVPCEITFKNTYPARSELIITPIRKEEDE